jgi:hypothetical protein
MLGTQTLSYCNIKEQILVRLNFFQEKNKISSNLKEKWNNLVPT